MASFKDQTPVIAIERAVFFTKSMRQTEGQPLTLSWAKALKNIAEKITFRIAEGQLLAGRAGQPGRHGILYPEIDEDFYTPLENLRQRAKNAFRIAEADAKAMATEEASYWKCKTFHERLNLALPPDLRGVTYADDLGLKSKFVVSETSSYRSASQWVHDYEKALKRGFVDLRKEMEERLLALDPASVIDQVEKKPFYEAAFLVAEAIVLWVGRHADLAKKLAVKETDEARKAELLEIAAIRERELAYPAQTFREAVQSQWFVQLSSRLEQKANAVISNGRLDQRLYPYYLSGLRKGSLNDQGAKELLERLWVEMAQFVDPRVNPTGDGFNEAYAHWEAMTIGGQTREGLDAVNEPTYLFLESKIEFPLNYPDLAARVHARSPQRRLLEVARAIQDGSGFPKLINDEEIVPLYAAKGAPMAEILDYAVSGCAEARMPNRDAYAPGRVYVNFPAAREMTLHNGRLLKRGQAVIGLETGDHSAFRDFEEFYKAYKALRLNLLNKAMAQRRLVDGLRPKRVATPFASPLHDLCVKEGQDPQSPKIAGGFDISYFEFLGSGTALDSLAAVKKLVYEERKIPIGQLVAALKADFEGFETVLALLKGAPKYGNADPYADDLARDLDYISQKRAARASQERGIHVDLRYAPIASHGPFGRVISATPYGRKAFTPLSDGSSASHEADRQGPTAVFLSDHRSKNSQLLNRASRLLNVKRSPGCVAGEAGAQKIVDLIRAFCDLKLWRVQVNVMNRQTLLEAQANPEAWPGPLVRVAGYSAYFSDLSPDLQFDVVERSERDWF
jgi:formate C-acetyltransferase